WWGMEGHETRRGRRKPGGARKLPGEAWRGGSGDRPAGPLGRQDQPAVRTRADRPVPGRSVPPARERARSGERAMIAAWREVRRLAVIGNALVGAALVTVVLASAGETLQAANACVAWAPPRPRGAAASMTIVNRGATDQVIVGVESPDYERIELHRSVIKDSVSTMQALDEVRVPANGRVEFAPTGLHLMLIGPRRPQALDGRVQIVLRLSGG